MNSAPGGLKGYGDMTADRPYDASRYTLEDIMKALVPQKRKPRDPPEHEISKAVKMLLELDGWRVFHMEPLSNVVQRRYSAELGCPDLLALRYSEPQKFRGSNILWLEIKRRGKKPAKHQQEWHARERALGAEVWIVDDFDFFREGYVKSGLNRSIRA